MYFSNHKKQTLPFVLNEVMCAHIQGTFLNMSILRIFMRGRSKIESYPVSYSRLRHKTEVLNLLVKKVGGSMILVNLFSNV